MLAFRVFLLSCIIISTASAFRFNKFTAVKPLSDSGQHTGSAEAAHFIDTSDWYGAQYTPTPAGNQLWWYEYDKYEPIVKFELANAVAQYGFTTLRMFLHNMVYDAAPKMLLSNIDKFLTLCQSLGIRPGFTFFDDCWSHTGATIPDSCVPVKGRHNGCWMACPQDNERQNFSRHQNYVTDIVSTFKNDSRVRYWEVSNELGTDYLYGLRNAAWLWISAISPSQPVISCWDDNNNTMATDHHEYDTNYPAWTSGVFVNPAKGGLVTEGGSRWFQHTGGDAGSVKTAMVWYYAVREAFYAGDKRTPWIPGQMLSWEIMVGQSHTRWHWGTPDHSPEPTIPWDAHMHANGIPISYTESGLILNYTRAINNFYYIQTFMPPSYLNTQDYYLTILQKQRINSGVQLGDGLYELSVWPNEQFQIDFRVTSAGSNFVQLVPGAMNIGMTMNNKSTVMATFNTSTIDCGLVIDAWNLLRFLSVGDRLDVWLNPMYIDINTKLAPFAPRVSIAKGMMNGVGDVVLSSGATDGSRVDYISVSKPDVAKRPVDPPADLYKSFAESM